MSRSALQRAARGGSRGVTLVELVVVLVIMGVVASVGATLVTRAASAQQDTRGRLALAQAADGALQRIAHELEAALPNSVRLTANAAGTWIEWTPVLDGGRYRQAPDAVSGTGDPLNLDDPSDNAFDVIGAPLATLASGSQFVIAPLGSAYPEADAYAGNNRRSGLVLGADASGTAGTHLAFTAAGALPQSSGTARFFIVGTPVTVACITAADGSRQLVRYSGYGWLASQPVGTATLASAGATQAVLIGGLTATGCSAAYTPELANIGLLDLHLTFGDSGASQAQMTVVQQIAIDNSP